MTHHYLSAHVLHLNLSAIQCFTIDHCDQFIEMHKGLSKHPISTVRHEIKRRRVHLIAAQREANRQQKLAQFEAERLQKLEQREAEKQQRLERQEREAALRLEATTQRQAAKVIRTLRSFWRGCVPVILQNIQEALELMDEDGRDYSNRIYDSPCIWSGYESVESIKSRNKPGYEPCKEHYYPRKWVGQQLIYSVINGKIKNIYDLAVFVNKYCYVHLVTPEQNRQLMKHQAVDVFVSPEQSYLDGGVEMVQVAPPQVHKGWARALEYLNSEEARKELPNYYRI